jgi:hypothetical protein
MRQQKCSDPAKFCDACNGFGYVTSMPNLNMPVIEALVKGGLGDKPVEVAEVECKACSGTGERPFTHDDLRKFAKG